MILADDNFATIVAGGARGPRHLRQHPQVPALPAVVEHGRGADRVPRRGPGRRDRPARAAAARVVLPLLATQILWINLITDSGPALAMGVDPHDRRRDGAHAAPPDRARDRRADVGRRARRSALVMALVDAADASTCYLPGGLIEGTRRPRQRAHRRLHGAGVRPAVQLLQRALGDRPAPSASCSPTAGCGARSRCRCCCRWRWCNCRLAQRRLRHRAADASTSGWCARRWPAWCCGTASCASW